MALAGHAIANDCERRMDGSLTGCPPANALAVHPGIVGVSISRPTHGDTLHPGERISVAVRHNRPVRVRGNGAPVPMPDIGRNMRTVRLDRARFLREQVFAAVGDRAVDLPRPTTALRIVTERLWFSHSVGTDDSARTGYRSRRTGSALRTAG